MVHIAGPQPSSLEITEKLAFAHRNGSRLALLFDYDGTLTPIVAHPALATLERGTRRLLQTLAALPGVVVGVLSGRALSDLRHMVAVPGLYYAGNSGLELDLLRSQVTHPRAEAMRDLLRETVNRLAALAAGFPGAWAEDKRLGLTLHYRQVARERLDDLLGQAGGILGEYEGKLRVVPGPEVWEVQPDIGLDKGSALRQIVSAANEGRQTAGSTVPLYAGDSPNDAEALHAAAALQGVPVGVGQDAPSAVAYRVSNPAALKEVLASLAVALGATQAKW